jgi:hypothetical protein
VSDGSVRPSAWRVVAAATALNTPIGSLYAFSVFLKPLEALLGLSRADLAFVFALAAAGFGLGMNVAPYVYRLTSPPILVLALALGSAVLAPRSPRRRAACRSWPSATACSSAPGAARATSSCSKRSIWR